MDSDEPQSGVEGKVKCWNGRNGFGFIYDTPLGEIFFGRKELPADAQDVQGYFLIGRPVVFDAEKLPDGRWKATAVELPYVEAKPVAGQVKSYSPKNGYGFISSSCLTEDARFSKIDVPEEFRDCSWLKDQLVTFDVSSREDGKLIGSNVKFQNFAKIAEPYGMQMQTMQAMQPMQMMQPMQPMQSPPAHMMGGYMNEHKAASSTSKVNDGAMQVAIATAKAKGLMTGEVKSYSDKGGFGFIDVAGYSLDAKFDKKDLTSGQPTKGCTVSFSVKQLPDGRLTASNVSVLGGQSVGGKGGDHAKRNASAMTANTMGGMGGCMGGMEGMVGMMPGMDAWGGMGDWSGMGGMGAMGMGMGPMGGMDEWSGMGGTAKKPRVVPPRQNAGALKQGMIKTYNQAKSYGFIAAAGMNQDCFFGKDALPPQAQTLHGRALEGKSVTFRLIQQADGKSRAENITLC
eukprot:TRINITY_DN10605_c0_g1_i1.p1 TRINITY_DN10605_c0_g1~~TRINITY_DN10605_c0_g1_i1.p1  ORF type:complete len:457 (+),score=109.35 TRINITY_DN10605_c0_g1_i1:58-1428(+)